MLSSGIAQSVHRYTLGWTVEVPFLAQEESLLFCAATRPALEPTHLPIQRVSGALSPGVKLITHLYVMMISRMVELYLHPPHTHVFMVYCLIN
jgi:hypothetical protein